MRRERVQEALREEISDILRKELKDPRVGFVSVTSVQLSHDLSVAKVHMSILGDEKEQEQAMRVLSGAAGFVRSEVAKRISLRHAPEIVFKIDTSIEHSLRIAKLLNELSRDASVDGTKADEKK
jgi:ribosome-binding factor A